MMEIVDNSFENNPLNVLYRQWEVNPSEENKSFLLLACFERAERKFKQEEDFLDISQECAIRVMRKLPGYEGTEKYPPLKPFNQKNKDFAIIFSYIMDSVWISHKRKTWRELQGEEEDFRTYGVSAKKPSLGDYDGYDE